MSLNATPKEITLYDYKVKMVQKYPQNFTKLCGFKYTHSYSRGTFIITSVDIYGDSTNVSSTLHDPQNQNPSVSDTTTFLMKNIKIETLDFP